MQRPKCHEDCEGILKSVQNSHRGFILHSLYTIAISVLFTTLLASASSAQMTGPILPGPGNPPGNPSDPAMMPKVLDNGNKSLQTVSIMKGRFFPLTTYARKTDTLGFSNQTDAPLSISSTTGAWSTGDIPAGETAYVKLNDILHTELLADPQRCLGRPAQCLGTVDLVMSLGDAQAVIAEAHTNGDLSDKPEWNAYYLVVSN